MKQILIVVVLCISCILTAQTKITGEVYDIKNNQPIANAHIDVEHACTQTNAEGFFTLENISKEKALIKINKEGFEPYIETLFLDGKEKHYHFFLSSEDEVLKELIVDTYHLNTTNTNTVTHEKILANYSGGLAQSLANESGLDVSSIGSHNGRISMRGMGQNRLVVAENGSKQEGQQWGADHGLEIDALQVEQAQIKKGAGAIEYGSDAIAGVVELNNENTPQKGFHAQLFSSYRSNNKAFANAIQTTFLGENHFFKAKGSYTRYADFKVPTNSITYLNTYIPIYDNKLTNTAGKESSFMGQWGYLKANFKSIFTFSNYSSATGFFAGAHGIPDVSKTLPDGSDYNIGYPYQKVNHNKLNIHLSGQGLHNEWNLILTYQNNRRKELSAFHTHFPNQPKPKDAFTEFDFDLDVFDAKFTYKQQWNVSHTTMWGASNQYKNNEVAGYSYLLPKYTQRATALFATHQWEISNQEMLEAGARFDFAKMDIQGYFDSILYDYLLNKGTDNATAKSYAQRSQSLHKNFAHGSFSLGYVRHFGNQYHSAITVASNFRFPTAMELSANGLHHGAFRHEQGTPDLKPEKGWALDWNHQFKGRNYDIEATLFGYYFSNYIYLKPTGFFSELPHGGQIYKYNQSEALITGFETSINYQLNKWRLGGTFEYIYTQQLGANVLHYPLPFSTPANYWVELSYQPFQNEKWKETYLSVQYQQYFAQNRIAQNELKTPGFNKLNLKFRTQIKTNKWGEASLQMGVDNLLNTSYYEHASYYRPLNIPALGRNIYIQIMFNI